MKFTKLFSSLFLTCALFTSTVDAALHVTVRDPANTDVPEYGTNPHFTTAPDGDRVIYFDVRVTNTGTTDEALYQIVGDLANADNAAIKANYTRPNVKVNLKPGETKIFTKYSVQPFQRFNTKGFPDGIYHITVTVNETVYVETVRFDNQDLYFITDSNAPAPEALKSLEARVTALESATKKIKSAGKQISDAK